MNPLEEKKKQLAEDLSYLPQEEKLAYLLDIGKSQPGLADEEKNQTYYIEGCQSDLWMVPDFREGSCFFRSDSDGVFTRGMAAMICDFYSGTKPIDILECDEAFLEELGILQLITPNRRSGISQVNKKIHEYAQAQLS